MEKYSLKNKKENSIEKDIKILEKFIDVWKNQNEAIDRILSDYKRLLKENEQYRTEVNSLEKENKNLKAVRKWYFENTVSKICTPEMLNKILRNDYISKQKVKDKIEELEKKHAYQGNRYYCAGAILVLQELLEESEES